MGELVVRTSPHALVVVVGLMVVACMRPLHLLRVRARGPVHIPAKFTSARTPVMVLCTHDYEHVDMLSMEREAKRWGGSTCFVVAPRAHNRLFCNLVHRGACVSVQGGTVGQVLSRLSSGVHVVLFLYREAMGTGAYHIARAWPNLLLARVRCAGVRGGTRSSGASTLRIITRTLGARASVSYAPLRADPLAFDSPALFMRALKFELYNH